MTAWTASSSRWDPWKPWAGARWTCCATATRSARMRSAAIARAGEFSADRIVPMYEALYAEVVR